MAKSRRIRRLRLWRAWEEIRMKFLSKILKLWNHLREVDADIRILKRMSIRWKCGGGGGVDSDRYHRTESRVLLFRRRQ
jgi:hypothetical protein